MVVSRQAHVVASGHGRTVDLGVARMRLLAGADSTDAFALTEFWGTSGGAWTVPHLHRGFEESFFVLDGRFTFTVGEEAIVANPGTYILVPRGTAHTITAAEGGGRFLTLMVPGGLEEMFFELGELPKNAIRDPAVRKAVSARYDSIPV
ncbi:Cupin 2 conserved barrel domain protein [Kribbella flavida DSM 17836]|uniref:Cupin 2 conserved barrel domain protein n=1 Tax=Kribbella flavida (strain DSM 17836 / JCM 10339 / NBRC 14399) TaxID=479435 RepID=D2PTW2_KRIFD|nr:cupin domain-containing protein [Kribbella flavida]ADB33245.1 Cupin 2 conserved barrel domain protein [Kribbella flavida DSM 17836]